jgi:hypothetical protein
MASASSVVSWAGFNLIKLGQVAIEHHALATDEVDTALNDVHWHGKPVGW